MQARVVLWRRSKKPPHLFQQHRPECCRHLTAHAPGTAPAPASNAAHATASAPLLPWLAGSCRKAARQAARAAASSPACGAGTAAVAASVRRRFCARSPSCSPPVPSPCCPASPLPSSPRFRRPGGGAGAGSTTSASVCAAALARTGAGATSVCTAWLTRLGGAGAGSVCTAASAQRGAAAAGLAAGSAGAAAPLQVERGRLPAEAGGCWRCCCAAAALAGEAPALAERAAQSSWAGLWAGALPRFLPQAPDRTVAQKAAV